MHNATIILVLLVTLLLLFNHLNSNKGIIWVIISLISSCIKILAVLNPTTVFIEEPFTLRLILLSGLLGFLPMPTLLLYIKSIIKKPTKIDYLLVLLLIPPALYAINLIPYYQLPVAEQIQVFQNQDSSLINEATFWVSWKMADRLNDIYNTILGALIMIYPITLVTRNKHTLSKKSYIALVQISFIVVANFAIMMLMVSNSYLHFFDFNESKWLSSFSLVLPLSIILFPRYLYDNISNSDLTFYLKLKNHISTKDDQTDVNQDKLITDASRVLAYLHNEKPYLSPEFSKHDIARSLDIPQNIVTDCFSKIIKIPFPVLRNQLRVEFAIEKFKNSGHLKITIAGIASESGFKNRSTFYTAFKEITKMTPVEWIKKNCDFQLEED
ncbi:helix-turn-helix domain-containing protein [Aquirufa lenticrescens]